ncbi:SpoIID/LytB domain protein [Caloramator fervidus]|uniref:SpoIID/LytB domain protein n=1 Tax=Caloramator fervidus TaxID=29344 RepID=A0A1H5RJZ7_9CLOT|nr:N-acetylmuramoyl-L-alanine amidase [Caloramator fervidus]SEF38685.1 SpoIID/LytB domain protein [Caloramator fervidus]
MDLKVKIKDKYYELEKATLYFLSSMDILNYEMEVLKALSVLARSKMLKGNRNLGKDEKLDFYLDDSSFLNLDSNKKEKLEKAVYETEGIIAKYNEKLVDFYVTKNCSGGTANSEDVLGYKIGYLRKVICKFCKRKTTESYLDLKLNGMNISYKNDVQGIFEKVERDETGRIKSLFIRDKKLSGKDFVEFLNLNSNRVYFIQNIVGIKQIGEGLGLGICLDGANEMARLGKNYEEILKYYYTGIDIVKIDKQYLLNYFNNKKIIIDPGHGGDDFGNLGLECEKNISLKIALYLKKLLQNKACNVLLTREEDKYLSLQDRINIINKERPDFFISIHQNAFLNETINGAESYCYKNDEESIELSNLILENLNKDLNIKNRGVRIGDYFILREAKVSGVILECFYITGNEDKKFINEEGYKRVANSIYKAICSYFGVNFNI